MKFPGRKTKTGLDASVKDLFEDRISRREFLRRTTVLGISAALVGDILALHSTEAHAAYKPSGDTLEKIKNEGGKLFVYNWDEYIHPDVIPGFEKEYGVTVTYDTFPGNEALLAKLQGGGAGYDVVFPTHNFIPIHVAQNLLAPINHDNIPLIKNVTPKFLDTSFDPGNKHSLPYLWGMTAMGHNTKYTEDDPNMDSWALLFESGPKRYSGRIAFTNEREEVMATALSYLGYSVNSRSEQELREAGKVLMDIKPHIKAFYPGAEETKALIQEDVVIGHEWNGEVVKARRENPAVQWLLPKEGGTAWFDNMAIPKVAPHKFTAEAFMNYMLRPDVAAKNSEYGGYATTNQAAVKAEVPKETAQDPAIYPTEEQLRRLEFLGVIPDDILPIYSDIWTRLLAS